MLNIEEVNELIQPYRDNYKGPYTMEKNKKHIYV